jgi:3',5'-cyclic AMP phosphodiesterase CpdA
MSTPRPVTVLHLSDMQFGKNHLFGRLKVPFPEDGKYDSLFARIGEDLAGLKKEQGLAPDLLVVSGDLAEWGMSQEFEQAFDFLGKLSDLLELPRGRVVVVPGNHDINRKACEAHFLTCAADGEKPVPPFWPKWSTFTRSSRSFIREFRPASPSRSRGPCSWSKNRKS